MVLGARDEAQPPVKRRAELSGLQDNDTGAVLESEPGHRGGQPAPSPSEVLDRGLDVQVRRPQEGVLDHDRAHPNSESDRFDHGA